MSAEPDSTTAPAPVDAVDATTDLTAVTEDLLVEDVSIDGMCGVY